MISPKEHASHDVQAKEEILKNIEQCGCHLALLSATDYLPGFAYSIGIYQKFGHPELICFALQPDVLGAALNHACDLIKAGETLVPGKLYKGFLEGYEIQSVEVNLDYYQNYVGYGGWFYNSTFNFPLYQLVWPDKGHRWPWDADFNPAWKRQQPLLDRGMDFKFYEERALGVYTSKQAFAGDPILYVYHNADGAWQFHTSMEPSVEDGILVCLEDITKLDPTINQIYHLEYGHRAWRASVNDLWEWEEDVREGE